MGLMSGSGEGEYDGSGSGGGRGGGSPTSIDDIIDPHTMSPNPNTTTTPIHHTTAVDIVKSAKRLELLLSSLALPDPIPCTGKCSVL